MLAFILEHEIVNEATVSITGLYEAPSTTLWVVHF